MAGSTRLVLDEAEPGTGVSRAPDLEEEVAFLECARLPAIVLNLFVSVRFQLLTRREGRCFVEEARLCRHHRRARPAGGPRGSPPRGG